MAYFDHSVRAPLASKGSFFANAFAAVQRYRLMRRTYNELSALSNRELDDLGLGRGDLMDVARKSAGYDV
ncbi:MAG: DUF1127 domain-containing protein [Pseudomonadota bacterium]